jgi:hypothetical protein
MDEQVRQRIEQLHGSGWSYVLAVTGGGAGLAAWLLSVPGASRGVLEVVVPYHEEALCQFLGRRPESFCSTETAQLLARRALERARWLTPGRRVAGVACTASLRSDRPKRGPHRFHVAVCHPDQTVVWSLTLTKEARSRAEEEEIVDRVMLNLMLTRLQVAEPLPLALLPGETIEVEPCPDQDMLAALLAGRYPALLASVDGQFLPDGPKPGVLLPGSFNPPHQGHWELSRVAAEMVGKPAGFEMTVINADKPPLEGEEVRCRLTPFRWRAPIWLTRCPTFAEKASLFPGVVFVVGADTAARIVQPRFYGDSEERMLQALDEIRQRGCRFLVAGRVDGEGRFLGLEDLAIPDAVRDLFQAIPASRFRLDISSTILRQQGANAPRSPEPATAV